MYKAIVFDLGNVLVRYNPQEFIKKYVEDKNSQLFLVEEIFGSVEWVMFDRGAISKDDLQQTIEARVPQSFHQTVKTVLQNWYQEIEPIKEMTLLVQQLKNKGYQLYLLSNAPIDFYAFQQRVPVLAFFDGVFISSDWKKLKPEERIYRSFYSHFKLIPKDCYFIDDLALNIEAAKRTGMDGVVFRGNTTKLVDELEKVGICLS